MELPDFLAFEPFNRLRASMNTKELGYFEIFDPKHHLTGIERSELFQLGLLIPPIELHYLLDFTLVYKNTRIWIEDSTCYHLANCKSLRLSTKAVRIGTSMRGLSKAVPVCKACLQTLQYQGFDDQKARKETYSQQVFDKFDLTKFWIQFHMYPVSEKRDLRKAFDF